MSAAASTDGTPAGGDSLPRRLLLLTDHSLDVIKVLGRSGRIEAVSSAIRALAGFDPEELRGRHYREFIHPDDLASAEAAFHRVLTTGAAGPFAVRARRKDGSWRSMQATARSFLEDPAINAIVVMTRDVTDELLSRQRLSQAMAESRRLSHELLAAQESERARLARDLHDDVGQLLVGLSLSMSRRTEGEEATRAAIASWRALTAQVLEHLRRVVMDLRPPELDEFGLGEALRRHAARIRSIVGKEIRVQVGDGVGRLSPDIEICAFRICQEALTNAVKYADAAHITVSVLRSDAALKLSVEDDGRGFDVGDHDPEHLTGLGLLGMRERAALVGGTLEIQSARGAGTAVRATLPAADERRSASDRWVTLKEEQS
ncbi:MAG: PAS domain S-box protein [Proteobacteria bacterium]|nr:PAS domain S-box protein [Pseudomonadota bacterium]